jgi:dimethylaniline monooxygenase (N-oxide forming)
MNVAVVGGGPSGLVTLKYLITVHTFLPIEPIEARLFESEAQIGGTFRYRAHEDAEVRCSRCIALASNSLSLTA